MISPTPTPTPTPKRATASKRVFVVAVTAAVGLLVATLLVLRTSSRNPNRVETPSAAVAAAVERTNLVLVASRLYLRGQTNPFDGILVEHAANGGLRSRSAVTNGLLHGRSEGWHTNGQIQVTEHFREGVSHGLRTKWHPNGQKLSEGDIVNGKFAGPFRRWSETGKLEEQAEFADGQPHGIAVAYFESGFVRTWARVTNGKVAEQKSWNDGEQTEPTVR